MRAAKRTSATEPRPRRHRHQAGFTLVESMIASTLLSVSVVGVSGTILSSYAHDVQSKQQHDAVRAAEALKDELSALPIVAASSSDVGLMDFATYNDSVPEGQILVATSAKTETKQTAAGTTGSTTSNTGLLGSVVGLVGGLLGGGGSSSGSGSGSTTTTTTTTTTTAAPVAKSSSLVAAGSNASRVVSVERKATLNGATSATGDLAIMTIEVSNGGNQTVKIKRLVTTTEAAANAGAGSVP